MDFWTFVLIVVIIGATKDILKKVFQGSGADKAGKSVAREIDYLKQRLDDIEKRLQAVETIVVDEDYHLNMKFKKAFQEKTVCDRGSVRL